MTPSWLQRLLLNLLDNAIKFTSEGGKVVLRVSHDAGRARIDVRDTGIGMPPDVTPHVFERFFQADPARSSGNDGAGVGLSLVKWIVDRHEGTIAVQSRVGARIDIHGETARSHTILHPAFTVSSDLRSSYSTA